MKYATVCSGIGAPEEAWKPLGWECVFSSEIEKFPSEVHRIRHPGVPNLGDMTKFKEWNDYAIRLICGGTPCQSFSVAGLRKGLDDPRGNLALVFLGIVDRYRPTWVVWENVPGVHSSWTDYAVRAQTNECREVESSARRLAGEAGIDGGTIEGCGGFEEADQSSDFDCFIEGLEELGYGVATTVLDAQYFGLAQRRERVFVVGHIGGQWQRAAAVLFDRESLFGNSAPRREKREGVTPILEVSARQGLRNSARDGLGIGEPGDPMFSLQAINAERDGYNDGSDQTYIPDVAWALQERDAKGVDSDTKDGHLIPVAFSCKDSGADAGELSPTLRSGNHDKSNQNGGVMPAVAFEPRYYTRDNKTGGAPGDVSVLKADASKQGDSSPHVANGTMVRRLTPKECERLQGFPDNFTMIPWNGKPAEDCPDSPRYRALGNSMAVPVLRWIGERIKLLETLLPVDTTKAQD